MTTEAETRIEEALLSGSSKLGLAGLSLHAVPSRLVELGALTSLDLSDNELTTVPDWLGDLTALTNLDLGANELTALPDRLSNLTALRSLYLNDNRFATLPDWLGDLTTLTRLDLEGNQLRELPESLGNLIGLTHLYLARNELDTLPPSLSNLKDAHLSLHDNPLAPELQAAFEESTDDLRLFLRTLQRAGRFIHEAKLVLVGEGAVGKSSLLAALRGEDWLPERPMTHGIEVKPLIVNSGDTKIRLNGWDFGGQPIYRATHQLSFTAPAIYLVVWNPRVGSERNFVDYWIKLIKHRADNEARILVVATHGESEQRVAYLDESDIRSRYGDMIVGFHRIDSRTGMGIDSLRVSIGDAANLLPHIGRWYPADWQRLRDMLQEEGIPYLTYAAYERLAQDQGLSHVSARSLARIANALGHWLCFPDDPGLSDLVILKPDWLSGAISLVLDDPETRRAHGLLAHRRLPSLWNDPARSPTHRYPPHLYPAFLQLMEKFDISYRVGDSLYNEEPASLIAQLVPAARPDLAPWFAYHPELEVRKQVCEIVNMATGEPIVRDELMYQLIVRFHHISLGRRDFRASVHWQGGIVLDDDYNGRAMITIAGNRITVQVRAAYPEFLLNRLTQDIRRYIQAFWRGLDVRIMVLCSTECGRGQPGSGFFDIAHLAESRSEGHELYPCPRCSKWLNIDGLLAGSHPVMGGRDDLIRAVRAALAPDLSELQSVIKAQGHLTIDAVSELGIEARRAFSQAEERYRDLILALDDEAREGPRLFSLALLNPSVFRGGLTKYKVQVTLWCEHSRLPVYLLNGEGSVTGIYTIEVPREWLIKAAPWIRATSIVIRTLLPVGLAALNIHISGDELNSVNGLLQASEASMHELAHVAADAQRFESLDAVGPGHYVDGSLLRTLHAFLRQKDPSFAGLERVRSRDRYLWVHRQFVDSYRPPPPEVPAAGTAPARLTPYL